MSVVSCKKFTNGVVRTINLPDRELQNCSLHACRRETLA